MSNASRFPPPFAIAVAAHADDAAYREMYAASIRDPNGFWGELAKRLDWITPFSIVKNTSFDPPNVSIKWFEDGALNVCANCVDRHVETRGDQTAILWEGDDPALDDPVTYRQLYDRVRRFANILKEMDVAKGDRVVLYLPMIPETAYAMLACARIGAVHSVVSTGLSSDALAERIIDCDAKLVITADEGVRGGRTAPLKADVDAARVRAKASAGPAFRTLVVQRTGNFVDMHIGHDFWYHEALNKVDLDCPAEPMSAEDPLFILYANASSGKPTGVVHSSGGYLLFVGVTHQYIFDYKDGEVFWCAADIGSATGHSYGVYGPLANGATTVLFEGLSTYPKPARLLDICAKHRVDIFYAASTEIRALMAAGTSPVERNDLSALRVLGSVGAPLDPEAWKWFYEVVGKERCPIVDTWWRSETGGILISPLPGATTLKPGSAALPFFGVEPCILDSAGREITTPDAEGALCVKDSWPGQVRTVFGGHDRFVDASFSMFRGYYDTGERCRRDSDGYYWMTGLADGQTADQAIP